MRSAIVSILATTLFLSGAALSQQSTSNRDIELHVGGATYCGEQRLSKLYDNTSLTRAVYDSNTLTLKRGDSLPFRAYLVSGSSSNDVTLDANLRITSLPSGCFQVIAGTITATPSPRCSEIIDAAGDMVGSFGIAYVDNANNVYGYDVFTVKVTK